MKYNLKGNYGDCWMISDRQDKACCHHVTVTNYPLIKGKAGGRQAAPPLHEQRPWQTLGKMVSSSKSSMLSYTLFSWDQISTQ